jgi:hypothetical protein
MKDTNPITWSENIIIVDADYIDRVAFDLIVNFERMIGRRIPPADLAHWIDCIALDGGLREGCDQHTSVVFIHDKTSKKLDNFMPGNYEKDLHLKAFKDNLGEFMMSTFPVEEDVVKKEDFFLDVTKTLCNLKEVKRVMIIPDAEHLYDRVRKALHDVDEDKHITVFAMQPMAGGNFRQEILGYSLMSALGIKGEELP